MPVVGGLVAVQGNTNHHAVLGEQVTPLLIEQDAIRVDPQIKAGNRGNKRRELMKNGPHCLPARKQRLSPVNDDVHFRQAMSSRVLSDPAGGARDYST